MAKNCYCDWNLVWWWFWIFGSGSYYVLSKIFGSGSDSDTIEIFRSGSDYQISISAQHWFACFSFRMRVYPFFLQKTKAKTNSTERLFYENEPNVDLRKNFIFAPAYEWKLILKFEGIMFCLLKVRHALHALHSWALRPCNIQSLETCTHRDRDET